MASSSLPSGDAVPLTGAQRLQKSVLNLRRSMASKTEVDTIDPGAHPLQKSVHDMLNRMTNCNDNDEKAPVLPRTKSEPVARDLLTSAHRRRDPDSRSRGLARRSLTRIRLSEYNAVITSSKDVPSQSTACSSGLADGKLMAQGTRDTNLHPNGADADQMDKVTDGGDGKSNSALDRLGAWVSGTFFSGDPAAEEDTEAFLVWGEDDTPEDAHSRLEAFEKERRQQANAHGDSAHMSGSSSTCASIRLVHEAPQPYNAELRPYHSVGLGLPLQTLHNSLCQHERSLDDVSTLDAESTRQCSSFNFEGSSISADSPRSCGVGVGKRRRDVRKSLQKNFGYSAVLVPASHMEKESAVHVPARHMEKESGTILRDQANGAVPISEETHKAKGEAAGSEESDSTDQGATDESLLNRLSNAIALTWGGQDIGETYNVYGKSDDEERYQRRIRQFENSRGCLSAFHKERRRRRRRAKFKPPVEEARMASQHDESNGTDERVGDAGAARNWRRACIKTRGYLAVLTSANDSQAQLYNAKKFVQSATSSVAASSLEA